METHKEWWKKQDSISFLNIYSETKQAYEAGQKSALPELTNEEWEECERWITTYDHLINMIPIDPEDKVDIIHSKLIRQALELREKQMK